MHRAPAGLARAALLGFAIAVAGILIIRSADLFPGTGYLMGAAVLLVGLAIMNAPILLRRNDTIVPPLLWLLSLLSAVLSIALAPFAIAIGGPVRRRLHLCRTSSFATHILRRTAGAERHFDRDMAEIA